MLALSDMGATIFPPTPAFYHRPRELDDIVDQTVLRLLDQFDFELDAPSRWRGLAAAEPAPEPELD
jgi:4-hydroxy-3-polyprenylbenzoate decarboxylase